MKPRNLASLVLAGSIGLAGCVGETVPTSPEVSSPSFSSQAASTNGTQLVVFKANRVPADFAARVQALGGSVVATFGAVGAAAVRGLDADDAAALKQSAGVEYVEAAPNFKLEEPVALSAAEVADADPTSPADPSTAARYPWQWNMRAINAPAAWAAGHLGSSQVTVAILDTGIDYLHADLQGRVDLSRSASFVGDGYVSGPNGENIVTDDDYVAYYFPSRHPITDIGYHGTHVSATVTSNAIAAAGVTSKLTLIGGKVCSEALGYCPGVSIFAGLYHAMENGADVVNMSLGGGFDKKRYPGYVSVLNRLFNELNRRNVTVVVAAGNSANDLDQEIIRNTNGTSTGSDDFYEHRPSYFATYCNMPHVVCVSATGPTASAGRFGPWTDMDAPTSYTNFGRSAISVAAPGGTGAGAVWAACSTSSLVIPVCQTGTFVVGLGGTSMASPHTAAVAALIVERVGKKPSQVKAGLAASADDLGQPGTDKFYGKGRINVARAVGM